MNYIDLTIIGVYFILIIYASIKSWDKSDGINSFAIGKREFSTYALTSTISATWISGSGFFIDISDTYKKGWYYLLPALCMGILLMLIAYVFVPRMKEFLGKTSVASAMGEIYGNKVQVLVGICGVIACLGPIAIQFKAVGYIGEYFFQKENYYFAIPIGIIVTIYSLLGGIRAVVDTDIIQKNAFFIAVPILFTTCLYSFSQVDIIKHENVDYSKFNLLHVLTTPNVQFWEMVVLAIYFTIPGFNPPVFQRISMGLNIIQVQKSWSTAAIHLTIFILLVSLIGWMLFLQKPTLANNEMVGYLIDNFLFTGLKGILIVGILAMTMSTADSFLNIGSVLMANDIFGFNRRSIDILLYARLYTVIIGGLSICLAISKQNLLPIVLMTASFYIPTVSIPLIFTILGYRSSGRCVLTSMIASILVVSSLHLLKLYDIYVLNPLIPGMITNAVVLVLSHFLLEKRKMYTGINDEGYFENYKYVNSNKLFRFKNWLNSVFFPSRVNQLSGVFLIHQLQKELGNKSEGEINDEKIIKKYEFDKKSYFKSLEYLKKMRYIKREGNYIKIYATDRNYF
jgi:Na+/proline symporter